ncbi:unnamed protein product [Ceratitis capitata]|uniref:(Mediterranean fruit fly) hypothetical protein n=1 Tax=Ceratitis capitata TaxID=7213 RepID=A0A811UV53_CERCA|nr:unnamed protein product [Ceratitis capitata]
MGKAHNDLQLHSEDLIKSKNYKEDSDLRLVNPADRVFDVCRLQIRYYVQLFEKYSMILMLDAIKDKTEEQFPQWFSEVDGCREHRVKLLEFLIIVLLYKNARWLIRDQMNTLRGMKQQFKLKKLN